MSDVLIGGERVLFLSVYPGLTVQALPSVLDAGKGGGRERETGRWQRQARREWGQPESCHKAKREG